MFISENHDFAKSLEKIWLSSPTMYSDSRRYVLEAFDKNWMSTIGENIDEIEKEIMAKVGCKHAAALSSGTSALHMCAKLAQIKPGDKVACSDLTFYATVNPMVYEGAVPVFIDSEYDTWNMDPAALEKAFAIYPEIKVVVVAHLYGTPGKLDEIKAICEKNQALLIEDAAESLGSCYKGKQTGTFGDFNVVSFNGNKIITGSSGGMFLTDCKEDCEKVKKWSAQSREDAPWYQHEEIGYNYRMSNVVAGVIRGQIPYLEKHIAKKKAIYERYKKEFEKAGLPVEMNPFDQENVSPNYWLSCMIIKPEAMCPQVRTEYEASFEPESGKSCPTEVLNAMASVNAEGRPIWKPMHMQPIYQNNPFVTREGLAKRSEHKSVCKDLSGQDGKPLDVGMDIFDRGLCLPSDIKMTEEQQNLVIEAVKACFE